MPKTGLDINASAYMIRRNSNGKIKISESE